MIEILAQVHAEGKKPFTAGIVLWDDKVVEAAPIVKYMKGWTRDRVRAYCKERGFSVSVVHELKRSRT